MARPCRKPTISCATVASWLCPDVICNAGGVTVSYFEWVQDFSSYFWSEDDIDARLETILLNALRHIWDAADHHHVSLRSVGSGRHIMGTIAFGYVVVAHILSPSRFWDTQGADGTQCQARQP